MEVYKYVTSAHLQVIKSARSLKPRSVDGYSYWIPEDPLLWKEETQTMLKYLERYSGASPIVLLRYVINELDAHALVQEADEAPWFKMDTRKLLKDYRRGHYRLPEVIINRSIPYQKISLVNPIPKIVT